MRKCALVFLALISSVCLRAQQYPVQIRVIAETSREALPGASVQVNGESGGHSTQADGWVKFSLPKGPHTITITHIGYNTFTLSVNLPFAKADTLIEVALQTEEKKMDEVIVASARTNSRIENTPTRVEVLGTEEVEEESGIKPSHIASLLGDVAGIQSQQTSAVSAATSMRIQGLPGDYTQILRDGMPLFGGYSGSFSVLQIPPLDLKQIEIIKGASSTLYGGGAIAGLINVISKTPRLGKKERTLLLNQSSRNESNLHLFLSDRNKKAGYTFFSGASFQKQTDVNRDGFSDLPNTESFFIHPTLFFYPNTKNTISIGLNNIIEDRRGGDMQVLAHKPDASHQFYIENQSYRNTLDINWDNKYSASTTFNVKGTASSNIRDISSNVFGMKANQFSYFTEFSVVHKSKVHDLVAGINISGDHFKRKQPDSTLLNNYHYFTAGLFVQDDWRIDPKFIIESGLRTDFHNEFGTFVLPRVSLLYKISPVLNSRLGGGLGYKVPSAFQSTEDERQYKNLVLDANVQAEKSAGLNWDVNWKKKLGALTLAINQSFYITRINHPLVPYAYPAFTLLYTSTSPVVTKGMETWTQLTWDKLELYLGYTLTDARRNYDPLHPHVPLSAKNKFASVLSYEFSDHIRAALEGAYTGKQYREDGSLTPGFPFIAAMLRYDVGRFAFVLNGENVFDYRQSKKEPIVFAPYTNPTFPELWAPTDGRIINLSVKLSL